MTDTILGFVFSPWGWLSLAGIAAAFEILLPGAFMIWLAAAALGTAATAFLLNMTIDGQLGAFAIWIVLALVASRRLKSRRPIVSDRPGLNQHALRVTGEMVTVTEAIAGGRGRVRLGDTEWLAEGPDSPAGARLKVLGADGTRLKVGPS